MKATAKDLRFHSKGLLDAVARGEEVVINFRGKPCAKLVPYERRKREDAAEDLFGIWEDNEAVLNVDGYVRELRKGRF